MSRGEMKPNFLTNVRRGRRAQTKLEALIALALLIIAGLGAWILYREQIIGTTKAMYAFVFRS